MALDIRFLESQADQLASLPLIFTRINEVVDNPTSSMSDIARIIMEDAGLSSRLLRLANSSFYGFPSRIETITHALTIIGIQQLRDLALATSVMTIFRNVPQDIVDMNSFWHHSTACGVAARVLATYRREPNVERYFVAGILHDIGRLMLLQQAPDEMQTIIERQSEGDELMVDVEREVLGIDHAKLGGLLLRAWKLPASVEEPVAYHHSPRRAGRYQAGAALVHLANILAHVLQLGDRSQQYVPPLEPEAWDRLGFKPSLLSSVISKVEQQYASAEQIIFDSEAA